jgi:hypothetical protein
VLILGSEGLRNMLPTSDLSRLEPFRLLLDGNEPTACPVERRGLATMASEGETDMDVDTSEALDFSDAGREE